MEIKKEEIVKPLVETFMFLNKQNKSICSKKISLNKVKIVKNNVLAMCEIANTINKICY